MKQNWGEVREKDKEEVSSLEELAQNIPGAKPIVLTQEQIFEKYQKGIKTLSSSASFDIYIYPKTLPEGAPDDHIIGNLMGNQKINSDSKSTWVTLSIVSMGRTIVRHHPVPTAQKPLVQVTEKKGEQKIEFSQKIYFAKNQATLLPSNFSTLTEIVHVLKNSPQIQHIEIQGHADDMGTEAYNQTLSQNRAETVKQFLIKQGIASYQLSAKGYGTKKPIEKPPLPQQKHAPTQLEQIREKNRRVEFFIK